MSDPQRGLLGAADPPPFTVHREAGASPLFFIGDHAGRALPRALGSLGVSESELQRHIAWDIGVEQVGLRLSSQLDACFVSQAYSRLVIDCNRAPGHPTSIASRSERTDVPGNVGLSAEQAEQRAAEIFHPYHDRVRALLDARAQAGRSTLLVALHSFTPVFMEQSRRWHAGVLYQHDARLPHVMLSLLRGEAGLVVGDNEPYAVTDTSDYSIHVHGLQRGLLHVELEVRQDLIAESAGQTEWAERLGRLLRAACGELGIVG